jgi:uridylate kinase
MDTSAIAISRDNNIPIKLFSILEKNCFVQMYMNKLNHSEIS